MNKRESIHKVGNNTTTITVIINLIGDENFNRKTIIKKQAIMKYNIVVKIPKSPQKTTPSSKNVGFIPFPVKSPYKYSWYLGPIEPSNAGAPNGLVIV